MKERIKYYPGFVGGMGVLLWEYREVIDIDPEKWISKEGIRMHILGSTGSKRCALSCTGGRWKGVGSA